MAGDLAVMQGQTLWRAIRLPFRPDARVEPCPGVPIGPGWLEYTESVWMVHGSARCAYVAARRTDDPKDGR